jgi:general secretion pathway protein A
MGTHDSHDRPLQPPSLPPIVRIPGQRPLLDLFPVSSESSAAAPKVPVSASRANPLDLRFPKRPSSSGAAAGSMPAAYETFYGLQERPFTLSSDPKFLYQSSEYDRVAQQMLGAIGRREPAVLLTGEMGMGKTTLCRAVVEQLDRRTLTSVITEPFNAIEDLLKQLLIDFGVVSKDDVARGRLASATEVELIAALREFLLSLAPLEAFPVVIVDEAQLLPPVVLSRLRQIVSSEHERLMQIVLVGQPRLVAALEKAGGPELARAFALRYVLGPLSDDEVGGYVMHRLRVAGTSPRVDFDEASLARLYAISGGKPRLVNLLCDRALATGFGRSASVIDQELIDRAAEDLDMAPPASAISMFRKPATVGLLLLLTLVGAAAGVVTFHNDVAAILANWAR